MIIIIFVLFIISIFVSIAIVLGFISAAAGISIELLRGDKYDNKKSSTKTRGQKKDN